MPKDIDFKSWLESDDYRAFAKGIEDVAQGRSFSFKSWFPASGRVFIPLQASQSSNEDIAAILKDFKGGSSGFPASPAGYEIADYRQGTAKPVGNVKSNVYKIGKILVVALAAVEQELQRQYAAGSISKFKLNQELTSWQRYYQDTVKEFQNDPSRVKESELYVVISSDIHDLGAMSTGRGWTSCMNLKDGSNKSKVYCEVRSGGFVAYVVKASDKEIERPIARIHIRRLDNKQGQSIAVPEESIYGQEIPGFMDVVKAWIKGKQGGSTAGRYQLMGGSYSDTFDKYQFVSPSEPEQISRWISKWLKMNADDRKKYSDYFIHALAGLFKTSGDINPKLLLKLKNFLFNSNTTIPTKSWSQGTGQFLASFALRFPSLIDKEAFDMAFASAKSDMQEKLATTFPNLVDDKSIASANKYLKDKLSNNSKFGDFVKRQAVQDVMDKLQVDNPDLHPSEGHSDLSAASKIDDLIDPLKSLRPIPEPVIRKLVDFYRNYKPITSSAEDAKEKDKHILRSILFVLHMSNSDTPTVQRFAISLLPKWDQLYGVWGELARVIRDLKENGRDFLPFLKKKLAEEEQEPLERDTAWHASKKERALENYRHIIDTIEQGSYSNKYAFSFS